VLTLAFREANDFSAGYLGTEHLLFGIVERGEGVAFALLDRAGIDLDDVRVGKAFVYGVSEDRGRWESIFNPGTR
jgi:hypothetical protein